jgi:hypothetical protein
MTWFGSTLVAWPQLGSHNIIDRVCSMLHMLALQSRVVVAVVSLCQRRCGQDCDGQLGCGTGWRCHSTSYRGSGARDVTVGSASVRQQSSCCYQLNCVTI